MPASDRPVGGSKSSRDAITLAPTDNVAVALRDLDGGVRIATGTQIRSLQLISPIPTGHKFALCVIGCGEPVLKYGECIGVATVDIEQGEHVHVHNIKSMRGKPR
jgi:altronate dehydratase